MPLPSARLLLIAASGVLAACATTGRAWVQEPEAGLASAERDPSYAQQLTDSELTPSEGRAAVSAEDEVRARPRLDRVISLGDSASAPAERSAPAAGAPATTPVVVNIVNYGSGYAPTPVYYSGVPYYGAARASAPTVAPSIPSPRSGATVPALGGDWRPLPSYGPSFPYHTAPASPWERSR